MKITGILYIGSEPADEKSRLAPDHYEFTFSDGTRHDIVMNLWLHRKAEYKSIYEDALNKFTSMRNITLDNIDKMFDLFYEQALFHVYSSYEGKTNKQTKQQLTLF